MATTYQYTTNIPVATHTPAQDQGNMQINCTSVSQIIGTDHLTFKTATGALIDGMHTVIHMENQTSDPPAVAGTGELYTKEVTFNSVIDSALFFRSESGTITQIVGSNNTLAAASGYTTLPGGIILQWGKVTGSGIPSINLFPVAFPNNVYNVTAMSKLSPVTNNGDEYSVTGVGLTGFFLNISPGYSGVSFYWLAIGN